MATVKTETRPRGRQLLGAEKMKTRTWRGTDEQSAKMDALGGAEWLRGVLDSTPWPRGTKPRK